MSFVLQPWQLCVAIIAGWIQRRQQEAIEYLRAENRVLRETHGSKRILLNDDQRRRLAVKGKILGRQRLKEISGIVPSLYDLSPGCHFSPRCSHAMGICNQNPPQMTDLGEGHGVRCFLY